MFPFVKVVLGKFNMGETEVSTHGDPTTAQNRPGTSLEDLKGSRTAQKGWLTRAVKALQGCLLEPDTRASRIAFFLEQVEVQFAKVQSVQHEVEKKLARTYGASMACQRRWS